MSVQPPQPRLDLVRLRPLWYLLSCALIATAIWALITRGINFGVDFTGGTVFQYQFAKPLGESREAQTALLQRVRAALPAAGIRRSASLQIVGRDTLAVRIAAQPEEQQAIGARLKTAIAQTLGAEYGEPVEVGSESIGAAVGREMRTKAAWALLVGCILMGFYISIRYQFIFAIGAVVALVHDCLIMTGAVALSGMEVNSPFVAALLTVVGYSVNDTIVIYDRIRENLRLRRSGSFAETVNASLWQTMTRSIYTVLTVLFVLWAIFLYGGATLHAFAFALLVGITSGAYSSIFNAPQVVVDLQRLRGGKTVRVSRTFRVPAPSVPTPSQRPTGNEEGAAGIEAEQQAAAPRPTRAARRRPSGKRKRRF